MLACDDSTSIDCAREMRGSSSIAKAVTPLAVMSSRLSCGESRPIRIELRRSSGTSDVSGRLTLRTMSDCE
jgi:hypothetical protein